MYAKSARRSSGRPSAGSGPRDAGTVARPAAVSPIVSRVAQPVEPGGSDAETAGEALYRLLTDLIRRMPRDLSLTALSTLATLDRLGACRITDLAVTEGVAQPSMTTLVTNLERAGYVERGPHPTDGRATLASLTPAGRDLLVARRGTGARLLADLIRQLPTADSRRLAAAVPAIDRLRALHEETAARVTAGE